MTALAPTQPLTPSERRIAQHVIKGLDAREIAAATQLKPSTVHSMLRTVRWKLACPERCSLTVVAHRILASGQITAPTPQRPAPDLSPQQISLLNAAAEHTVPRDIALAAGLAPADLRDALDQLLVAAEAQDTTELVVLAHSWQLLPAEQAGHVTQRGAIR
ncbi:LuxR C-terminal-related transcriptional regulator [Streptomyces sp. NPDC090029]|uniref:LuxR C-terminal-related transcriptional regulator n=1 Tax=Streptomyces sp. NPDC090029 TaxID=3365924 RepID=UPI00382DB9C3